MRILIADDSIVSRHLLDASLRKWGYEVVVACDGVEALKVLEAPDAPKLAILDWVMPGLTGPEVCRRVREKVKVPERDNHEQDQDDISAYTYILLLTSKSLREDLIEGLQAGADDYVTKPFDQHELKVRLDTGRRILNLQHELVVAKEALREQATRDFLTRIWNRSYILDALQRELNRATREDKPVGVVLADLDHFKLVNDTYGHFAGDAVLRESARRMQTSMRHYDTIGRYGGEEFLIVLPGCEEPCTSRQAERMRASLASEPIVITGGSLAVTCSFGATSWRPGTDATPESLIRIADEALYQAKHQGRNCVVHRPPGEPRGEDGGAESEDGIRSEIRTSVRKS